MEWKHLKNEFEPVTSPSLVNMEIQFRQCALRNNKDPEICLTELEDFWMNLEDFGSRITLNQFMIQIFIKMTSDYDLQSEILEKRINDKMNRLTIDEIRVNLNFVLKDWLWIQMKKMRVNSLRTKVVGP
jgi:hypothetical protein